MEQIVSPHTVEGIKLHLRYQGTEAGPLFWAQYSFLGMNPNGLQDKYCPSYFNEMRNLTLSTVPTASVIPSIIPALARIVGD